MHKWEHIIKHIGQTDQMTNTNHEYNEQKPKKHSQTTIALPIVDVELQPAQYKEQIWIVRGSDFDRDVPKHI